MQELSLLKKPLFWLVCLLALLWVAIFQLPDSQLHLVFCDVGQGDAILISYRSTQVLIDGGPDTGVLECLADNLPFWDRQLEMVVLTHPEADHLTGLVEVLGRYEVRQIMVNSIIPDSVYPPKYPEGIFGEQGFWEFHRAVLEEKASLYHPQAGDQVNLGPIRFSLLWPEEKLGDNRIWEIGQKDTSDGDPKGLLRGGGIGEQVLGAVSYSGNLNETSIVLQLSFGNFDALFTGDIGSDTEKKINWSASRPGGDPVEVLKVAHHGSKYSTGEEFLQKVQPELAVVSVGKNPWKHPTEEVIERLSNQAIKLLRTDQEGAIKITTDGRRGKISGSLFQGDLLSQ